MASSAGRACYMPGWIGRGPGAPRSDDASAPDVAASVAAAAEWVADGAASVAAAAASLAADGPSAEEIARQDEQDVAELVVEMQRLLTPWLQQRIEQNVNEAMEKAARAHSIEAAEASAADDQSVMPPPVTVEAIGRRLDEALRVAVTSVATCAAAAQPLPAPRSPPPAAPPLAPDALQLPIDQAAARRSCMAGQLCSPKSEKHAHIAMQQGPEVIELGQGSMESEADVHITKGAAAAVAVGAGSPGSATAPLSARSTPGGSARSGQASHDSAGNPVTLLGPMRRCDSGRSRRSAQTAASVWTVGTSVGAKTIDEGNKKAIVVNFRRLIEIKEKLDIIHEVLKATTIALLTLLIVDGGARLAFDLGFLGCGIILYALHEMNYDCLDIHDYSREVALLGNDGDQALRESPVPGGLENPNRCIQALSFSKAGRRGFFSSLLLLFLVTLALCAWSLILNLWVASIDWWGTVGLSPDDLPDIEHFATLLVVGSLMIMCHFAFEAICAREFRYVMPKKRDRPWDITKDGIPVGNLNWLFGLPCVWFSSRQAYEDLRTWVTLAAGNPRRRGGPPKGRRERAVWQVFFEEMAVYALEDMACAERLRRSLLMSKLYDKEGQRFLRRRREGEVNTAVNKKKKPTVIVTGLSKDFKSSGREEFFPTNIKRGDLPAELGIELFFYDNRSAEMFIPHVAQEDADADAPVRLRHQASM